MLLEFRTKNYKSFVEEVKFSMLATPKQKGLDYSLYIEKIKGKVCKGLSSSVIYGPNAAGKTNIVGAMECYGRLFFKEISKTLRKNHPLIRQQHWSLFQIINTWNRNR